MPQLHFREIDSRGVRIRLNILPFKQMLGDYEVVGSQIPLVENVNKMISAPALQEHFLHFLLVFNTLCYKILNRILSGE